MDTGWQTEDCADTRRPPSHLSSYAEALFGRGQLKAAQRVPCPFSSRQRTQSASRKDRKPQDRRLDGRSCSLPRWGSDYINHHSLCRSRTRSKEGGYCRGSHKIYRRDDRAHRRLTMQIGVCGLIRIKSKNVPLLSESRLRHYRLRSVCHPTSDSPGCR